MLKICEQFIIQTKKKKKKKKKEGKKDAHKQTKIEPQKCFVKI